MRVLKIDGEPWFVASDRANTLGYPKASAMTRWMDEDEKGVHILHTPGGSQECAVVSESGLYAALLKSRMPAAKRFKKWVTGTVLPAIRKDGAYIMGEEKVATGEHSPEQLLSANAHDRRQRCGGTGPMISQRAPESKGAPSRSSRPEPWRRGRAGAGTRAEAGERSPTSTSEPAGPPFPGRRHSPDTAATTAATSADPVRRLPEPAHRARPAQHAPGSRTAPAHRQQSPPRGSRPAAAHHGRKLQKREAPSPLPWQANADAPAREDEDGDNVSRPTRRRTRP